MAEKPCRFTRERRGQKCPKFRPHGLWVGMNINYDCSLCILLLKFHSRRRNYYHPSTSKTNRIRGKPSFNQFVKGNLRTRTGKAQRRPFQKVNAIEKENKPEKSLSQLRKDVQANHQQPPGMVSHEMLIITIFGHKHLGVNFDQKNLKFKVQILKVRVYYFKNY